MPAPAIPEPPPLPEPIVIPPVQRQPLPGLLVPSPLSSDNENNVRESANPIPEKERNENVSLRNQDITPTAPINQTTKPRYPKRVNFDNTIQARIFTSRRRDSPERANVAADRSPQYMQSTSSSRNKQNKRQSILDSCRRTKILTVPTRETKLDQVRSSILKYQKRPSTAEQANNSLSNQENAESGDLNTLLQED